jgi:HPt (histidine-containing phosphotransfer) domain-containing protein
MFFKMLKKLEGMSLIPNLREIAIAVDAADFSAIKQKAHSLKGASGYIAAGPVHYCCYFI